MSTDITFADFKKIWEKLDAEQKATATAQAKNKQKTLWSIVSENYRLKDGIVYGKQKK